MDAKENEKEIMEFGRKKNEGTNKQREIGGIGDGRSGREGAEEDNEKQ